MKTILLSALSLLLTLSLNAQMGMGKPKEIEEIKSRKLLVITEVPNKKAMNRLEKKGKTAEIEQTKKMYEDFNAMVQGVVKERWSLHSTVEFKTWDEFKRLSDKSREKFAVMYFMSKRAARSSSGDVTAGYTILAADMDEEDVKEHSFISLFQTYTIDLGEDIPVDKLKFNATPVYTITLPEVYPSSLSVIYAIQSTNIYFEKRLSGEKNSLKNAKKEIAENSVRLKDKTLLICKDWIDEELDESMIKSIYPHNFELVEFATLEERVRSGDKQYAWLVILPVVNSSSRSNSVIFMQQIVDNANGEALAMNLPSMGNMMLKSMVGGKAGSNALTEKTLKDLVESMKE